ncbi:MAG: hypothetical protein M3069_12705 [Chloroflexota bacterium]|nr:hypothetical protein [Chloroflexota bacterium]
MLALTNRQALLELDEAHAVRGWPDSRRSNPATYTGLVAAQHPLTGQHLAEYVGTGASTVDRKSS